MNGQEDVGETNVTATFAAYRVHGTQLQIGDLVPPSTRFAPASDPLRTAIEDAFEMRRPRGMPERRGAIFLFETLDAAYEFALTKNRSWLYKVSVRSSDVLHRADWMWLEEANTQSDMREGWESSADSYWSGLFSAAPRVELLVGAARVEAEITIHEDARREFRAKRYGLELPPPQAN